MAEFGWVYFSKEQKEVAGTIIKMMSQEGMVDELGIGAIRDAFANQLFPGISTVQTRAKYFFIVPYILKEYENLYLQGRITKNASKYLEDEENKLMWQLSDYYKTIEKSGVIGITLPPRQKIVRRPSSIYWNGIGLYKLIATNGLGVDAFLNTQINTKAHNVFSELVMDDSDNGDDLELNYNNKLKINSSILLQSNWRENLNIELSNYEAELLSSAIIKTQPNTLFAYILQNKEAQEAMNQSDSFADFANISTQLKLPESLMNQIKLAHDFSEIMYGSNVAYNYWLHKDKKYNTDKFEEAWNEWKDNLQTNLLYKSDSIIDIVINSDFAKTTKERTKQFIKNWWQIINSTTSIEVTKQLVSQQELFNKKAKSRLQYQRWDDVIEGKQLGLGRLNFRFVQAKRIINDILKAKNL